MPDAGIAKEQQMDGWTSVEELTGRAFSRSQVVMANEAHSGLARCVRTREVGQRMVRAAHQAGVRRLAMEALSWPAVGVAGPIRQVPDLTDGYLGQPDMRALIGTAVELGWTLWAYEAVFEWTADADTDADTNPHESTEFTNWREQQQAGNLAELVAAEPGEPLLVWCGNGHALKVPIEDWVPMGHQFQAITDLEPFVIDQIAGVDWPERGINQSIASFQTSLAGTLHEHGGAAGILSVHAPEPLSHWPGVDAFILSTDNGFT
jgi:hypothetical protein